MYHGKPSSLPAFQPSSLTTQPAMMITNMASAHVAFCVLKNHNRTCSVRVCSEYKYEYESINNRLDDPHVENISRPIFHTLLLYARIIVHVMATLCADAPVMMVVALAY